MSDKLMALNGLERTMKKLAICAERGEYDLAVAACQLAISYATDLAEIQRDETEKE